MGYRMHLEDIQEAWVRHTDGNKEFLRDNDGANIGTTNRMLLPSFLQAFTVLARTKYCNLHEGRGADHLLLRDVFDNIANPTVSNKHFAQVSFQKVVRTVRPPPTDHHGKRKKVRRSYFVV